jgi:hypothetical protein
MMIVWPFLLILLLLSVLSIGRGAALLPWLGGMTGLCLLGTGTSIAALVASLAAVAVGIGFGLGLRLFEQPVTRAAGLYRAGALAVMALGMTAFPGGGGMFPIACGFAVTLAGVFAALCADAPIGQCAGMVCAVEGLFLLAGLSRSMGFVVLVAAMALALTGVCAALLRRIAWGAADG